MSEEPNPQEPKAIPTTPPPISVEETIIAGDTAGSPGQPPGAGQPVEELESPVPAMAHEILTNPLLQKPAPTEEPKVTSIPVTNTPEKAEAVALQAQRDQAYRERNELVALLARMFPSGYRETAIPGWDPEWRYCIYIDLPVGQCSWHIHEREKDLLAGLPLYKPDWDGHTTDIKYARIREFWQIWLAKLHGVPQGAPPVAPAPTPAEAKVGAGGMRTSAEMRGNPDPRGLAYPIQNPDGSWRASHYPHEIPSGSLSAELGHQTVTGYAIVELFGHMKIAGKITERTIAGEGFLQLDIEQEDGSSFTRLIHPKSIYALNPVPREVALELATRWQYAPVKPYDVPKLQEAFRKEQAEDQRAEVDDQFDPA
jgi:hypothetical protein